MKYIQQGYTGSKELWKYLIIPTLFFGLIGLNFLAMQFIDVDIDKLIKTEIATKGENRFLVESLLPFAFGLAVVLFWARYVHNQSLTALTTARKKIDWKRVFFSFGLWAVITVVFFVIDYLGNSEDYIFNFELIPFCILLVISILLVPLQTSFEEYFFRGYLMQGIGLATKNSFIPLVFTSVVFGLLHIANPEVGKLGYEILVYYIGTGFFLGIVTLMDDGLELALGFHAANNLITALLVTADWTAFQTNSIFISTAEPSLITDVYVPVLVVFPVLLLIFAKKYDWKNWKGKLLGKIPKPTNTKS